MITTESTYVYKQSYLWLWNKKCLHTFIRVSSSQPWYIYLNIVDHKIIHPSTHSNTHSSVHPTAYWPRNLPSIQRSTKLDWIQSSRDSDSTKNLLYKKSSSYYYQFMTWHVNPVHHCSWCNGSSDWFLMVTHWAISHSSQNSTTVLCTIVYAG